MATLQEEAKAVCDALRNFLNVFFDSIFGKLFCKLGFHDFRSPATRHGMYSRQRVCRREGCEAFIVDDTIIFAKGGR